MYSCIIQFSKQQNKHQFASTSPQKTIKYIRGPWSCEIKELSPVARVNPLLIALVHILQKNIFFKVIYRVRSSPNAFNANLVTTINSGLINRHPRHKSTLIKSFLRCSTYSVICKALIIGLYPEQER